MPKFAANLTMLYHEHGFLERFAAARADGFQAVEFLFPYAFSRERLADALARAGLKLVLHNLPAGNWETGERGIACHPSRIGEFQDGVGRAIDYAKALGCPQLNCLIGIPPPRAEPENIRHTIIANLRFAAAQTTAAGIRLLIEPINDKDIPGFWLNHVKQAAALIAEIGATNLFVQYDLYHQQRMDGELSATFLNHQQCIAHIQLADNPGRNEPGSGEINYPFLFDLFDRSGYAGWIGCEYRPRATTSAGLKWLRPYMTLS